MNHNELFPGYGGIMLEPTPVSDIVQQQHILYQHQQLLMLRQRLQQEQQRLAAEMNYFSSLGGTKRRRGQRVGFVPEVLVYFSPRDVEEVPHSWYSKEELANFKEDRKSVIRALKKVNFDLDRIDKSIHQLRGLEAYLSISFNKMMQQKRTEVIHSVLIEQHRQRQQGICDPEALRDVSSQVSEWAQQRGLELGQQDAVENGTAEISTPPHQPTTFIHNATTAATTCWGHESDVSETPSLCSTATNNSTSSSSSSSSASLSACPMELVLNSPPPKAKNVVRFS